ncbi:endospore germination permease [Desulfosporosinus sp. FKB]|uniref:GerAB/ArcD/ProY family transporter n=1 Tax=Desulfosporosinus sp. FKB TaxID=1969835 RepID=UPI000B4A30D6|nr:endospore germination permease [Desulfosporosinus sp. FKB]
MLEDAKITPKQLIFLVAISRLIVSITFFPVFTGPPGNQDVWISEILSLPASLLLTVPFYLLWKRFPEQSLFEYAETLLGKTGKAVVLLYILYFFHGLSLFLYEWSAFLTTAVMPETPVLFVLLFLFAFCAYAVLKGIEVISRFAEFLAPLVFGGILVISLLLAKDMDLKVFMPFMEKSMISIGMGGFAIALKTSEIVVLAMLLPHLKSKKEKAKLVLISSYSLIALLWLITTVTVLGTLGLDLSKMLQFPYFSAVRLVNIGDFIERIESIHLSIWILSGYLKTILYFYIILIGLSHLVGIKDYRPLVISTLTVLLPVSLSVQSNISDLNDFLSYPISIWINIIFIIVIPYLLLAIAFFRKQGVKNI